MLVYTCSKCLRNFATEKGCQTHQGMAAACKNACVLTNQFVSPAESAFAADTQATEYHAELKAHLVDAYGDMRYEKLMPGKHVDHVKECFDGVLSRMRDELVRRLSSYEITDKDGCKVNLDKAILPILDVHRGIASAHSESTARKERLGNALLEPVKRSLVDPSGERSCDFVYDVPLDAELERCMLADPNLYSCIKNASDSWASRRNHHPGDHEVLSLGDITDGSVFRDHPRLGDKAPATSKTQIAVILYYDEVEPVNALGAFVGKHKLGMYYWALVNLPPSQRMSLHHIHLATVCLDSDMAYYGSKQIVSGPPNESYLGSSFGAAMRRLHDGCLLSTLINGRLSSVLFEGWVVCLSADYPAAAALGGFAKSTSAQCFCRECDVSRNHSEQNSRFWITPNSFLAGVSKFVERTLLGHESAAEKLNSCSTSQRQDDFLRLNGVRTYQHAFSPDEHNAGVPLVNVCTMIPYDFFHVEAEGILKTEIACMVYAFCRQRSHWKTWPGSTPAEKLAALNNAMYQYDWPVSQGRPPYFTEKILEGTVDGCPKKKSTVHMTGLCLTFNAHANK